MGPFLNSHVKNRNVKVNNPQDDIRGNTNISGNFCRHVRVPLCYCTVWEQRAFAQKGLYSAWTR